MNKKEFLTAVDERVSILKETQQKEWDKYEHLRNMFIRDYPVNHIPDLTLIQYVAGKVAEKKSFCYRIEHELDMLGRITSARTDKFGIYYGKTKTDRVEKYRFAKKWGGKQNEAFKNVKNAIINLLENHDNLLSAKKNALSTLFKGKLLFLYHPEKYLSVYSEKHLRHFVSSMNLMTPSDHALDMQNALMELRNETPQLYQESPFLFSALLYDLYGYPDKDGKNKIPTLRRALSGAKDGKTKVIKRAKKTGKVDYEEQSKYWKKIGDRGEELVFETEKEKLRDIGRSDLANRVMKISSENDAAGYDILSYEADGIEKHIEVKATIFDVDNNSFNLSANEYKMSKQLSNYYLALIWRVFSEEWKLQFIKNPNFDDESRYLMTPASYKVVFEIPNPIEQELE
jgi:hypothetical protein